MCVVPLAIHLGEAAVNPVCGTCPSNRKQQREGQSQCWVEGIAFARDCKSRRKDTVIPLAVSKSASKKRPASPALCPSFLPASLSSHPGLSGKSFSVNVPVFIHEFELGRAGVGVCVRVCVFCQITEQPTTEDGSGSGGGSGSSYDGGGGDGDCGSSDHGDGESGRDDGVR